MKNFIFIFGTQGSGKSTQAEILSKKIGYEHVSSGELLREMRDKKDPLGVELAEKYWLKGSLVPNDQMEKILFRKFTESDVPGFVVEGYPRNIHQLHDFIKMEMSNDWFLEIVYYIMVSEEVCMERIHKRVGLEHRADETPEAIKRRLDIYYAETTPVIDEVEKMGLLVKIDGERSIESISYDMGGHD